LAEEQTQQIVAKWMDWYAELVQSGIVENGRPLASEGTIVSDGGVISDGPFAESKETVGGYFIVNARNVDQAIAVAKQCPALPYGVRVEVRQMLEACPFEKGSEPELSGAHA
jgi:hypothetical protein